MTRLLTAIMVAAVAALAIGLSSNLPARAAAACDPDNGGITLPDGFCAQVVASDVGPARHLTVAPNGDIYVALRNQRDAPGGIVALRDTNNDGRADVRERFGDNGGTGIEIHDGHLYLATTTGVVRYRMREGQLVPSPTAEVIVEGLPEQRSHADKGFAFDGKGNLYVNVGAPSNACQQPDRTAKAPGQEPCGLLERHGGIWRFDAGKAGQSQADGTRFATGMRQMIALAWHPASNGLYVVQHGRDQLNTLWPGMFSDEQNAELPSEEVLLAREGSDFGWPYCHHDWQQGKRVLAPEFGGDGKKTDRCDKYPPPVVAFPGHWAPNDAIFYTGTAFPARYRGGLFIAFHGSWNRAPLPQGGYNVSFAPFTSGKATGKYEVFADGFAGQKPLAQPRDARFRPMGLAQGPDGTLYISESVTGRIWRVRHAGAGKTQ